MINTVFFGTHTFATVMLQALIDDPDIDVTLVITQPDKPVGRKKVMTPPPVKLLAEKHDIAIDQPASLRSHDIPAGFDIGVTAQYGLLVPKHILDAPERGILNVHTSMLPKYRGASPIQSALLHGDSETGVTIMRMDVGLDTGPILSQHSCSIAPGDTYLVLDQKLATIAAPALTASLKAYYNGSLVPTEQDDTKATHCKQFTRDDGRIDFAKTTESIYNRYRGLTPWPGIWTMLDDKRLKLLDVAPSNIDVASGTLSFHEGLLLAGTSDASIEIKELQLEGKQAMTAVQFMSGYALFNNTNLI